MVKAKEPGAEHYLPDDRALESLEAAAGGCHGCSLYQDASQTVFGHGLSDAPVMLVGEQPGDREDIEGLPFVGPAGRLLARALDEAGVDPKLTYQTNAVKHFKFTRKGGTRRIHQKPSRTEVVACRPLALRRDRGGAAAGARLPGCTAAQSLLGGSFRLTAHRGESLQLPSEIGIRRADNLKETEALPYPDDNRRAGNQQNDRRHDRPPRAGQPPNQSQRDERR